AGLNKQRAEQPILLNFCSPGNLLFWHVGKVIWRTISQWFCSLMNVCLLITYFSTNKSIIITKREIRNFHLLTQCHRNKHLKNTATFTAKSGILGRNYLKKGRAKSWGTVLC